eukprot:scaffold340838_cov53-Prasinocladus_malaysianus.AAC.2
MSMDPTDLFSCGDGKQHSQQLLRVRPAGCYLQQHTVIAWPWQPAGSLHAATKENKENNDIARLFKWGGSQCVHDCVN